MRRQRHPIPSPRRRLSFSWPDASRKGDCIRTVAAETLGRPTVVGRCLCRRPNEPGGRKQRQSRGLNMKAGLESIGGALLLLLVVNGPHLAAAETPAPSTSSTSQPSPTTISDQDVSDAYIYLLGRLLVTRQQQLDFKEGFVWNQLVHRKPGEVEWPNPNLDVAYSEAWVAVDESSCTILTVPKVTGRYYTVQFLNGWGESLANVNERVFPDHPSGDFAV